jgi:hypothetical protein
MTASARSLITTQQRSEVFRIQSFGQVGGPNQVDELDRQEAAFGSLWPASKLRIHSFL